MGEMTHTNETLHTSKGPKHGSDQGVFVQTHLTDFQLMSLHHNGF